MSRYYFFYIFKYISFAWSIADFFVVLFFILLVNLLRHHNNKPKHILPFVILFFCSVLNLTLPLTKNFLQFFMVEGIVVNIHYFTIIFLFIINKKLIHESFIKLREKIKEKGLKNKPNKN
jgi:hypothetical protein